MAAETTNNLPDAEAAQRGLLKAALGEAIAASDADGRYSDEAHQTITDLIAKLNALTPTLRPCDQQDVVAGPWKSLFAQFGPRHTAGKPIRHESTFKTLSFGNFPNTPMLVLDIVQEIHAQSYDYNNVHLVENVAGDFAGLLIIFGKYTPDPANPQRYLVEFSRAEVRGAAGEADEVVRAAFGFADDQRLIAEFRPPRLSSDIVYCDDDTRINFGSMGGVYVMRRIDHPGYSVRFA